MFRVTICIVLCILLVGCSARMTPRTEMPRAEPVVDQAPLPPAKAAQPPVLEKPPPQPAPAPVAAPPVKKEPQPSPRAAAPIREESLPPVRESLPKAAVLSPAPEQVEPAKAEKPPVPVVSPPKKIASLPPAPKKGTAPGMTPVTKPARPLAKENLKPPMEDAEGDIMEQALLLLNESHGYWVRGDLENALEMLDQAYALLIDTNGNPDIARQKDDLRLMISKRILSLYNSIHTTAKGIRSEIPVVSNPDVEKEIRQFQTVEREFFIASYQRSAMYRPIILRELKKAGLPEELSWLPLVESGFKINALSTARALGLWQFIPSTGYKYGLNRDDWVDERMDIEKSTRAAIDYLKELHSMFGDWLTVLAAYNCGEGRIMRNIAAQHINYLDRFWDLYHRLPYETARYVPRFIATLLVIRDPQKYGIDLGPLRMSPLSYETVEINKSMRLQDIAQKLDIPEERLNILNAELRHRITPNRPYKLRVPTDTAFQLLKVVDDIASAEPPRDLFRRGVVIKHRVRQGETLASIAGKYKTSEREIRNANEFLRKRPLAAGQRINVPMHTARGGAAAAQKPDGVITHKVQKGDTLASLSRTYGVAISDIKKVNHMGGDILKVGQTLKIEKARSTPQPPPEEPKKEIRTEGRDKAKGKAKAETESAPAETDKAAEGPAAKKYTVKKGDTLGKIARANRMTIDQLRKMNRLKPKEPIRPGQVLLVK